MRTLGRIYLLTSHKSKKTVLNICHLHDGAIFTTTTRILLVLLSCTNERFCNLHLAVITKIKHERKNEKDSGHSSKMTSSCNWPVEVRIAHIKGTTQTYLTFFFLLLFCKLSIIFFSVTMKIRSYSIPISGLLFAFLPEKTLLYELNKFLC